MWKWNAENLKKFRKQYAEIHEHAIYDNEAERFFAIVAEPKEPLHQCVYIGYCDIVVPPIGSKRVDLLSMDSCLHFIEHHVVKEDNILLYVLRVHDVCEEPHLTYEMRALDQFFNQIHANPLCHTITLHCDSKNYSSALALMTDATIDYWGSKSQVKVC